MIEYIDHIGEDYKIGQIVEGNKITKILKKWALGMYGPNIYKISLISTKSNKEYIFKEFYMQEYNSGAIWYLTEEQFDMLKHPSFNKFKRYVLKKK